MSAKLAAFKHIFRLVGNFTDKSYLVTVLMKFHKISPYRIEHMYFFYVLLDSDGSLLEIVGGLATTFGIDMVFSYFSREIAQDYNILCIIIYYILYIIYYILYIIYYILYIIY